MSGFEGVEVGGNAAFSSRASQPLPPSIEERFFVRALRVAEQVQRSGQDVSAAAVCARDTQLPLKIVGELFALPKFQRAAESRGILLGRPDGLTTEQEQALRLYFSGDDREQLASHAKKLARAGVTPAKWRGWLRQAPFESAVRELTSDVLGDSVHVAKARLAQKVDAGDQKAIEFVLKMTGEYDPNAPAVDMDLIFRVIGQVLEEELREHPGVMAKIATRLRDAVAVESMRTASALPRGS